MRHQHLTDPLLRERDASFECLDRTGVRSLNVFEKVAAEHRNVCLCLLETALEKVCSRRSRSSLGQSSPRRSLVRPSRGVHLVACAARLRACGSMLPWRRPLLQASPRVSVLALLCQFRGKARLARPRIGWKVYPGFPIGLPWVPVFPPVFVRFPHIKRSPVGSREFSGFHSSC